MGWQQIINADGFGIALTGMSIVFAGLVLISLYITAVPKLFLWMDSLVQHTRSQPHPAPAPVQPPAARPLPLDDAQLLAAIGYVVAVEMEHQEAIDHQRITIQRDESQRLWVAAGKMRMLSTRI